MKLILFLKMIVSILIVPLGGVSGVLLVDLLADLSVQYFTVKPPDFVALLIISVFIGVSLSIGIKNAERYYEKLRAE